LNKKVKEALESIEDISENILNNIHGVSEEALGNQEHRKNKKL
jgi:hypothetical protein